MPATLPPRSGVAARRRPSSRQTDNEDGDDSAMGSSRSKRQVRKSQKVMENEELEMRLGGPSARGRHRRVKYPPSIQHDAMDSHSAKHHSAASSSPSPLNAAERASSSASASSTSSLSAPTPASHTAPLLESVDSPPASPRKARSGTTKTYKSRVVVDLTRTPPLTANARNHRVLRPRLRNDTKALEASSEESSSEESSSESDASDRPLPVRRRRKEQEEASNLVLTSPRQRRPANRFSPTLLTEQLQRRKSMTASSSSGNTRAVEPTNRRGSEFASIGPSKRKASSLPRRASQRRAKQAATNLLAEHDSGGSSERSASSDEVASDAASSEAEGEGKTAKGITMDEREEDQEESGGEAAETEEDEGEEGEEDGEQDEEEAAEEHDEQGEEASELAEDDDDVQNSHPATRRVKPRASAPGLSGRTTGKAPNRTYKSAAAARRRHSSAAQVSSQRSLRAQARTSVTSKTQSRNGKSKKVAEKRVASDHNEQNRPSKSKRRRLTNSDRQAPQSDSVACNALTAAAPDPATSSRARPSPWQKKAFLSAGLYSSTFKLASPEKARKASRKSLPAVKPRGTVRTRVSEGTSAFPAPVHYGNTLLVEQRDFRLAYPIAKRGEELRDRMDAKKKPPPYKSISKNRWVSRKRIHGEVPVCICEPSSNCGEECMNRVLQYICNPKQCPCGERCTNISLAKRAKVTTTVAYYGERGFGLQTQQRIQKDQFIDEYRGEVINLAECARRVTDFYKATGNFYFLDYDNAAGEVLDGGLKGNITRFANHSCDPNCYIEKWLVCGSDEERDAEFQIGLYALRDIEPGEELTYDYGWSAFARKAVAGGIAARGAAAGLSGSASSSSDPSTSATQISATPDTTATMAERCLCKSANCSGILGGKKLAPGTVSQRQLLAQAAEAAASASARGKSKRAKAAAAAAAAAAATAASATGSENPDSSAPGTPGSTSVSAEERRAARQAKISQHVSTLVRQRAAKEAELARAAEARKARSLARSQVASPSHSASLSPAPSTPMSTPRSQQTSSTPVSPARSLLSSTISSAPRRSSRLVGTPTEDARPMSEEEEEAQSGSSAAASTERAFDHLARGGSQSLSRRSDASDDQGPAMFDWDDTTVHDHQVARQGSEKDATPSPSSPSGLSGTTVSAGPSTAQMNSNEALAKELDEVAADSDETEEETELDVVALARLAELAGKATDHGGLSDRNASLSSPEVSPAKKQSKGALRAEEAASPANSEPRSVVHTRSGRKSAAPQRWQPSLAPTNSKKRKEPAAEPVKPNPKRSRFKGLGNAWKYRPAEPHPRRSTRGQAQQSGSVPWKSHADERLLLGNKPSTRTVRDDEAGNGSRTAIDPSAPSQDEISDLEVSEARGRFGRDAGQFPDQSASEDDEPAALSPNGDASASPTALVNNAQRKRRKKRFGRPPTKPKPWFDKSKYPPGTEFVDVAGRLYDFEYTPPHGKRARVFTRAEWEQLMADRRDRNAYLARMRRSKKRTDDEPEADAESMHGENDAVLRDEPDEEDLPDLLGDESPEGDADVVPDVEDDVSGDVVDDGQAASFGSRSECTNSPEKVATSTRFGVDPRRPEDIPADDIATTDLGKLMLLPFTPAILQTNGMSAQDVHRAKGAFNARVRRLKERGYDPQNAARMAFKQSAGSDGEGRGPIVQAIKILTAKRKEDRKSYAACQARIRRARYKTKRQSDLAERAADVINAERLRAEMQEFYESRGEAGPSGSRPPLPSTLADVPFLAPYYFGSPPRHQAPPSPQHLRQSTSSPTRSAQDPIAGPGQEAPTLCQQASPPPQAERQDALPDSPVVHVERPDLGQGSPTFHAERRGPAVLKGDIGAPEEETNSSSPTQTVVTSAEAPASQSDVLPAVAPRPATSLSPLASRPLLPLSPSSARAALAAGLPTLLPSASAVQTRPAPLPWDEDATGAPWGPSVLNRARAAVTAGERPRWPGPPLPSAVRLPWDEPDSPWGKIFRGGGEQAAPPSKEHHVSLPRMAALPWDEPSWDAALGNGQPGFSREPLLVNHPYRLPTVLPPSQRGQSMHSAQQNTDASRPAWAAPAHVRADSASGSTSTSPATPLAPLPTTTTQGIPTKSFYNAGTQLTDPHRSR